MNRIDKEGDQEIVSYITKNKLYNPIQARLIFSNRFLESCFLKSLFVFTLGFSIRAFICLHCYVFFPCPLYFSVVT